MRIGLALILSLSAALAAQVHVSKLLEVTGHGGVLVKITDDAPDVNQTVTVESGQGFNGLVLDRDAITDYGAGIGFTIAKEKKWAMGIDGPLTDDMVLLYNAMLPGDIFRVKKDNRFTFGAGVGSPMERVQLHLTNQWPMAMKIVNADTSAEGPAGTSERGGIELETYGGSPGLQIQNMKPGTRFASVELGRHKGFSFYVDYTGSDANVFDLVDNAHGQTSRFRVDAAGNVGFGMGLPSAATPITSRVQVPGLPVYATNAAAVTGGLTAGAFYRTGADPDLVCVVH